MHDTAGMSGPLLKTVDAISVPVPSLAPGLEFYHNELGHELVWRHDQLGQAALRVPGGDTELVLATRQRYEPNWLVDSADEASARIIEAGGRVAVVADPFGNELVLIDLSKGRYRTDADGSVTSIS
jgi:catechol 2,3-dioxygenase-like lactoylglutathione lyase family enzyme